MSLLITLNKIAEDLGISPVRLLKLIEVKGVFITDPNALLTDNQMGKIKNIILQSEDEFTQEKRALAALKHYAENYKIFIDTCSLLDDSVDIFLENMVPELKKANNKFIIPFRVIEELQKHEKNTKDKELVIKAKAALVSVEKLMQQKLIDIRGEKSDNFADNVFSVVFTKFRLSHKLLLITQDRNLGRDILALNDTKSAKAYDVLVKRINKHGFLSNIEFTKTSSKQSAHVNPKLKEIAVPANEKFKITNVVTKVSEQVIPVSNIPGEGQAVYCSNGSIQLTKQLATGGEGSVFLTNTPYVAKIYKKERINLFRFEKIKRMISKKISCDGVCWPIDILFNEKKEFVGYLMPKADGKELQKSLFIKPLLLKNFPHWKKKDTVQLCLTILGKIEYLHKRNIILGDINPLNILVVSPKEVYFVDTDSYQIEEFPCPVGTINYTAPEIQGKNFGSFLRTFGNEYFAVSTLLFMIMLPGKPPYSQQGGENPMDNIKRMDFSYPFRDNSNKKTPDGPWRFIWSHLTYDIKESFYKTFRKNEAYSTETNRIRPKDWIDKFSHYLNLLESGKFAQQDSMSEELFPTRFKRVGSIKYANCKLCNQEHQEELLREGYCRECLNSGEFYSCSRCNEEIVFTNFQKYIRKSKKHTICKDCHEHLSKPYTYIRCTDCNDVFEFTNREHEFYKSKGFDLPKRCSDCKSNRSRSHTSNTYASYNQYRHSSNESSSTGTSILSNIFNWFK